LFSNPIKIFSTYAEMLATHLDESWTQDVQLRLTKIFRSVFGSYIEFFFFLQF
jgi:hypothetical protein